MKNIKIIVLMAVAICMMCGNFAIADINTGLVAYYPFNGNANDESTNSNNGTVHGATLVPDRYGNPSSAYQFDGVDDYIEIPNSPSVSIYDKVTVVAWIKTDYNGMIVDKYTNRNSAGVRTGWQLKTGNTDFYARCGLVPAPNDTSRDFNSGEFASDGTWHLVGMTWDDSNDTFNLFFDGALVATYFENRHINSNTRPITIGKRDGLTSGYYTGIIDDVRIYNRAISENEMESLYTGLVANYPFNGNANDESGNDNHGTVNGATLVADRFGNPSSAYQFDGVDDYIEIPNSPSVSIYDKLTVLAWIKADIGGKIVNKLTYRDTYGSRTGWSMSASDTNGLQAGFGLVPPPNDTLESYLSGALVTDGIWHLVGMSWDDANDRVKFFVDGNMVASFFEDRQINSNVIPLTIGKWPGLNPNYYTGIIDDVRIYNQVLSTTEVSEIYDSFHSATSSSSSNSGGGGGGGGG